MPCVYIIPCKCKQIYVGSTLRHLSHRQSEHRSECFNKQQKSYTSPAYKHFRNCGMKKQDVKCIKIADTNPASSKLDEAKFIKYIGNLNTYLSVIDEEKKIKREESIRVQGQKTKYCNTCGGQWTYSHKNRHFKSKKHLALVEENNIISSNSINEFMDSTCEEDSEKGEVFLQGSNVESKTNIQTKSKEECEEGKLKTKTIGYDKENSIFFFKGD